jgi:regulator of sigma E protease
MISVLTTWLLPFVFILGAAVILHEFGHFIVAKLFKIRVETFSFGFGPRLIGWKWGATDYRISAIPLGGYVKLGGDESNAPIEGAGASDIPADERFDLRPRWQKISVAVAGPVMNILTALAIPFAAALAYGVPTMPAPVVSMVRQGGDAERAGLKPSDRIVSFEGTENPTWNYISGKALLRPGQDVGMVVERDGKRIPITLKVGKRTEGGNEIGQLDFQPDAGALPVIIESVTPNTPAAEAGLRSGDQIVAVDGQLAHNRAQITQYIQDHGGKPIRLTIVRGQERLELWATPRVEPDDVPRVGIRFALEPLERVGPVKAFSFAVGQNIEILRLTGDALGQVFKGQRSVRDTLSGPIGIARESSRAATELGWTGVFTMLAFLSLNLGVFNLLPIPVLDGGAIFLLLIEGLLAIVGLSISMKVRERIQQVGFVVVILLMVFVITNDLLKQASIWRDSSKDPPAAATPAK